MKSMSKWVLGAAVLAGTLSLGSKPARRRPSLGFTSAGRWPMFLRALEPDTFGPLVT